MNENEEGKKEEDLFNDLPEDKKEVDEEKKKEPDVDEENDDEDKEDEDKEDDKKEDDEDDDPKIAIIKSKDKAIRDERRRRKDAEAKLKELEGKKDINPEDIVKQVQESIELSNFDKSIATKIKSIPGVTKSTAKLIYDTVKQLPPTDDAGIAVDLAVSYIKEQKRLSSGYSGDFVSSSGDTFLAQEEEETAEVNTNQKQIGRKYGRLEDEDFKKFNKMPSLE